MKSKGTTAVLALFLGGIGAHRLYLGQGGLGVCYLLFCWTFIPSIIAFFEFFYFAFMSDETFDKKYNGEEISKTKREGDRDEIIKKLMEKLDQKEKSL